MPLIKLFPLQPRPPFFNRGKTPIAALLLVASFFGVHAEDASKGPPAAEARFERAINAVYPALVQIYVLTVQYGAGREYKFQAAGSGAIISPEGHVITNHHVAGKAIAIKCILSSKEELDAKLIGTDALADICIVKLDLASRPAGAAPLPVAHFGSSAVMRVGDSVLAMGCPLTISQSVTSGILANKEMMAPVFGGGFSLDGEDVGSLVKWLGHDAQIFPGNSGGPLVNLSGEIVGINEIGVGLSGAIPSDIASDVAKELIEHGHVVRAWVGIQFQPLLKSSGPDAHGVLIGGIVPGSPAEKAGLQPGDIMLKIDDDSVDVRFKEHLPVLLKRIFSKGVGKAVNIIVQRGDKTVPLTIETEKRDDERGKESELKEWGITARRVTRMESKRMQRADTRGVLIGSVGQGSAAEIAIPSIHAGDVLVEVSGKPVADLDDLIKITASIIEGKSEPVATLVAFERGLERFLTVVDVGIRPTPEPPAEAKKAQLPVLTQVLSRQLAAALGLKGKKGVVLTQVFPGCSAEEAGLRVGDVLTQVDGVVIDASERQDSEVFATMMRAYKVGAKPEFTVIRNSQTLKIAAELTTAPKAERELKTYEDLSFEFKARDISFMDRVRHRWTKDQSGALISEVDNGGWAQVGGLQSDDLILSIDGQAIGDIKDLETQMKSIRDKKPKRTTFFIRRGITTTFVELEPAWADVK